MNNKIKFKGKLGVFYYWPVIIASIFAGLNIGVYFFDIKSGFFVSVFLLIYIIATTVVYAVTKSSVFQEMIGFASSYSHVQKKFINELEIPYVLIDGAGKIMWLNEAFKEIAGVDKRYRKSITSIFPNITKEFLQKNAKDTQIETRFREKDYRVAVRHITFGEQGDEDANCVVGLENEHMIALYFFDETELNACRAENVLQKQVAALVYIDNYEEALESVEDVKRSLLTALIDRKVSQYFSNVDGLIRKIEKDKYFVVFKYKYLKQLEEDRFSLLEDVKTVKVGNEMAVTLSIGVGLKSDNYNENYMYARSAIDLALGRGGDQAVVKEKGQIHYYGGNTEKVEKNTRVKARVKALALREIMEGRDNVIIMGHSIPDVDSIGAAVGIYCAAKVLGKKAQIVVNDPTSSVKPLIERFQVEGGYPQDMFINSDAARDAVGKNTLLMVVDTNKPSYTECPELLRKTEYIGVFDHHRQGSDVIENPVLSYIEPYASSASEMVAEVLQYFQEGFKLDPKEADCLYAGILIDTNNFTTKAGVRTFEAAAYLRRSGADVTRVRKMIRYDMAAYKASAEAVRNAEVYKNAFAIAVCPSEGLQSPTIIGAQAANELLNIIGIKASFVLTQHNGRIYVSARSIDEINVQLVMERLGGGGHLAVAGAQLLDCDIEMAKQKIKDTLEVMLKEGDIK